MRAPLFIVEKTPGPSDYLTERSSVANFHTGASFKSKPKIRDSCSPGPSTYNSEKSKDMFCRPRSAFVVIPKTGRKDTMGISHKNEIPGPGDYNLEWKRGGPKMGFTIP